MFKCFVNRERLKIKNIGGWGQDLTDFLLFLRFFYERNMSLLKHLILPLNDFKINLFYQYFLWGGGSPLKQRSRLDGRLEFPSSLDGRALCQLSDDPYHTEFVSWHVEHFSFPFRFWSWPWWKIPLMFFFFEPFTCSHFNFSYPLLPSYKFFVISCFDKIFAGLSWISAEHGSIRWICHHPFEASPIINLGCCPVNLVCAPAHKSSMRRARSRIWIVWWPCKSDTKIGALLHIYMLGKLIRPFAIIFLVTCWQLDDCCC